VAGHLRAPASMLRTTKDECGRGGTTAAELDLPKKTLHTEKKTIPKRIQPAVCCFSDRDPLARPSKNTKLTITRIETSIAPGSGTSIISRLYSHWPYRLQIQSSRKLLKKA
jgi:hypothetical protein